MECLESQNPKTVDEALPLIDAFEKARGRFDFVPSHKGDCQDDAFCLESVDALGVRQYAQHVGGVLVDCDPDSIVNQIELLQETFDDKFIQCIIDAL